MKRAFSSRGQAPIGQPQRQFRPQLLALEGRLPPGDVLLGSWLAGALLGPSLVGLDLCSATGEIVTENVPARHRAAPTGSWKVLETDDAPAAFANPSLGENSIRAHAEATRPAIQGMNGLLFPPAQAAPEHEESHRRPLWRPDDAATAHPGALLSAPLALSAPGDLQSTAFITPPTNYQLDQAVAAGPPLTEDKGGAGVQSRGVRALFDLGHPTTGPFPSNAFSVPDRTQNTDLRVNLPYPDCQVYVSDCEVLAVLNELDGFNLQPRLSIPFSGPIDMNSVTSSTIFLVSLGSTMPGQGYMPRGTVVGINQIVWDVATSALHVESDALLAQHTRFALLVTNGIRDADGDWVEASPEFRRFRQTVAQPYKRELLDAVQEARRLGVRERDLVTASVFTTQSATAVLEKIRDQIHAATPVPADFNLGPKGERAVFNRSDVTGIQWQQQTGDNPPSFTPTDLGLVALDIVPGAVGRIAFGKYASPDYEVHPGEFIPPVGTRTGTPVVQGVNEVYFVLMLPSGPQPASGWPVALFGHGNNGNQYNGLSFAATMAAHGIATLAINAVGHGFGPLGTLTVSRTGGGTVTFLAGGRGRDQDGDHVIGSNEGVAAAPPWALLARRDGARQTTVDLLQLVREIDVGMEVDGDGVADLDSARIYAASASFGGSYVGPFLAIEPGVRAGILNVVGGGWVSKAGRLSAGNQRPAIGGALAARAPALLNAPGIAELDGVPIASPRFHETIPLRDGLPLPVRLEDGTSYVLQSPMVNTVAGAMEIREVLENEQWVTQAGNPLAYAPHLRKEPLRGMSAKPVIVQFAGGDQTANNPMTTAIVRAGDLADRATFYRHDLAYAGDPTMPTNPHSFISLVTHSNPRVRAVARGYQEQIAAFFASAGEETIHPDPKKYFETPIRERLPEDLGYVG